MSRHHWGWDTDLWHLPPGMEGWLRAAACVGENRTPRNMDGEWMDQNMEGKADSWV